MAKDKTDVAVETAAEPDAATKAILLLAERLQMQQPSGITDEQLEKILAGNAQATRKALRPEVENHPDVSDYNPNGERDHPRPKLLHKVFFSGMELEQDELKLGEIELFNKFTHSCVARNGAWKADLRPGLKGGKGELHISIPVATTDDRMELPNGMSLILTELLGGAKAADPASLAERVAELEKQLAGQPAA
jgi:hypothetical protein